MHEGTPATTKSEAETLGPHMGVPKEVGLARPSEPGCRSLCGSCCIWGWASSGGNERRVTGSGTDMLWRTSLPRYACGTPLLLARPCNVARTLHYSVPEGGSMNKPAAEAKKRIDDIFAQASGQTPVVTKELREALEDEVGYQLEVATSMDVIDDAHLQGAIDAILSKVLPNVRWAKDVLGPLNGASVSYMVSLEGTGLPEQHNLDPGDGLRVHHNLNDGDTVAILKKEGTSE